MPIYIYIYIYSAGLPGSRINRMFLNFHWNLKFPIFRIASRPELMKPMLACVISRNEMISSSYDGES